MILVVLSSSAIFYLFNEERAGCFTLIEVWMPMFCVFFNGAVCWSVVCECCIIFSWSYSGECHAFSYLKKGDLKFLILL